MTVWSKVLSVGGAGCGDDQSLADCISSSWTTTNVRLGFLSRESPSLKFITGWTALDIRHNCSFGNHINRVYYPSAVKFHIILWGTVTLWNDCRTKMECELFIGAYCILRACTLYFLPRYWLVDSSFCSSFSPRICRYCWLSFSGGAKQSSIYVRRWHLGVWGNFVYPAGWVSTLLGW